MPFLQLITSAEVSTSMQIKVISDLSRTVADCLGKPEQYVMVTCQCQPMVMGGKTGPTAWISLRSIGGLNAEVNNQLADQISRTLNNQLGIKSDRIFIHFADVPAASWAWKGETFG